MVDKYRPGDAGCGKARDKPRGMGRERLGVGRVALGRPALGESW